jgi:polysaccharide pyruvyl transferase WcaK-like protein
MYRSSKEKQHSVRIGIFGHYGNRNLGDEAIIEAVIDNFRARIPNAEIHGFSLRPTDTAARYGIPTHSVKRLTDRKTYASPGGEIATDIPSAAEEPPLPTGPLWKFKQFVKKIPVLGPVLVFIQRTIDVARVVPAEVRFIGSSYRCLRDLDLLVIAGSNQLLDNFGGTWHFPYNLLKWATLARMTDTPVAFASVGAGPLEGRLSKRFARRALSLADYVSFRDTQSEIIMREAGFRGDAVVCPDLAHSLVTDVAKLDQTGFGNGPAGERGKSRIALNPMPIYDKRYWCEADDAQYAEYIDKLVEFCGMVVRDEFCLTLFNTQPRDVNVIEDVLDGLRSKGYVTSEDQYQVDVSHTVPDLLRSISAYDFVVATRFHGVVLPLFLGKPTIGICYGKKTEELLVDMGQSDFYTYFEDFSPEEIFERLHLLVCRADEQVELIRERSIEYREMLNLQYDRIVGLVTQASVDGVGDPRALGDEVC